MILPLFAFANAGVSLQGVTLAGLTSLLPLALWLACFIGKPLGISLFWLAGPEAEWASGCRREPPASKLWRWDPVRDWLTMSIFIATLAFGSVDPALINWAKLGILIGSVLSAVVGYLILASARDGYSPRGINLFAGEPGQALLDIIRERSMSHINYNHLYYFWHVYKEGSVVGAAEALFLTPQTIPGRSKPWRSACREII
ncbi:Na+/H+ antiporter NhaA type [Klebsiella pneumoniae]|uniref:Na+/H+ antiporter NhaA type n=1 Tax=Klebsiella pneumoniae TaxID=573 RepID=A0A377WC45_KLEPN|nr:Na+/H+ antiporter NhaA type [Klebsiella pneumoniae]